MLSKAWPCAFNDCIAEYDIMGAVKERLRGVEILEPGFSKEAVRKNAEQAHDWQWQEMASSLYTWTDRFENRFLDPIARLGQEQMPDAIISFASMNHKILGHYTVHRNAQGLLDEITMNTKHLNRPMWQTLETLLHEQVHLWQGNFGDRPVSRNYHNREFVHKCEGLGLHPRLESGVHWKPADGVFAQLMGEYGIQPPAQAIVSKDEKVNWWDIRKKERKGRSTLSKWSCGCQNVRVGRKEFHAQCTICGNVFARVENPPNKANSQERFPSLAKLRQAKANSSDWRTVARKRSISSSS